MASSSGANKMTVTVPGRAAAGQPRVISSSSKFQKKNGNIFPLFHVSSLLDHRPGAVSEDPSLQSKIKLKVVVISFVSNVY